MFRKEAPVTVLGPGKRAVIWVQGCTIGCKGCTVPESWDIAAGHDETVDELTAWLLAQPAIDGLTISGGEPMLQAEPVNDLIDRVREAADLGIMCYTGYTYDVLRERGTVAQMKLLSRVDLLVDGPYIQSRHGDLLWRGSANQRLHCLTPRYAEIVAERLLEADRSAGIEIFANEEGALGYVGVPAVPGFREAYYRKLAEFGVHVRKAANEEEGT